MKKLYNYSNPFPLEKGVILPEIEIAYHTYGELNSMKTNVVWICHALTASSDAADWWDGLVGSGKVIDTDRYFVVCANILGSCYGSTGPTSINPNTQEKYGKDFPWVTIRDLVKAHQLLKAHLGIEKIQLLMGGSMGAYQVLEWAVMESEAIQNMFLIATSAEESAWGKAIHTAQRMAISADPNWDKGEIGIGDAGLKAARGIGMLTYRNYALFKELQSDTDLEIINNHRASTYIQYQGQKLADRFDALTYYKLTELMDTHQLARGRANSVQEILMQIPQETLIMGISSDILCPPAEQKFLAEHLSNSVYYEIDSSYGHDGFLIESEKIGNILLNWIQEKKVFA